MEDLSLDRIEESEFVNIELFKFFISKCFDR